MSPAAEDLGDAEARETAAIREYATWSSRVRTLVIAVTVVVGLAVATGAFFGVLTASGYGFRVSLYAAGVTWAVVTMIGVALARYIVRVRSPRIIDLLAAHWGVERSRIAEVVDLAQKL